MKIMKKKFFLLLLMVSQFAYSSESIYEDAIKRLIIKKTNRSAACDSSYHNLAFEYNLIFEGGDIPSNILGHNIIVLKSIKEYLNKCENGSIKIYTIEKIDFCETCIDPFSVKIKVWNIIKDEGNKFTFTQSHIYAVSYTYNCKRKKFKYKSIDYYESDWNPFHDMQEARWKGWIN